MTSIAEWIRPSYLEVETEKLLLSPEMSDVVEAGANICEWTHELTGNETAHVCAEKLEVLEKFFAIPGVFEKAGKFKASWERWENGKDSALPVVESGLLLGNKAAKLAQFTDAIGVVPLKEGLDAAKGSFWGTLGIFETIQVYRNVDAIQTLNGKIKEVADTGEKEILEHRWQITVLSIIRSVNTIAQSLIALVSIFFVSMAHGLLFSPLVFLGLTSTWLTLHFGIHFYEKIVDKWAADRLDQAKGLQVQQKA